MPTATQQDAIAEAQKKRSEELDKAIAAYLASLDWMLDGWGKELDGLLAATVDLHPAQLYSFLKVRIPASLESFGYTHWANEVVSSYSGAITAANEMAAAASLPPESIDAHALAALQQIDHDSLLGERDSTIGDTSTSIVRNQIGGASKDDAMEQVRNVIKRFRTSAGRTVDTGILMADRFAIWGKFAKLTDRFLYFGPEDSRNRPFCAAHVGKTYTVKEIRVMDNGQGLPVATSCGGYRCRHNWIPQLEK